MNEIIYSLIYSRVSSKKQVEEGNGLKTQEQRGLVYSIQKKYVFEKTFFEEGVSGATEKRPGMTALLEYIDAHKHKRFIVIIDDLSRLGRDMMVYGNLKNELLKRGVLLDSPNFKFDQTPEAQLSENITVAMGVFARQQNARQVTQRMAAKMEMGYYCLRCPPLGYKYFDDPEAGRMIKPHEPFANIVKEALEAYEKGRTNTIKEVKEFIDKKYIELGIQKTISLQSAHIVLKKLLYTGYIEYPRWKIKRFKGKHTPIISIETYNRVQEKLLGKAKINPRSDHNSDFPLRSVLLCNDCKVTLTAGWSHGKSKKYPYYWCKNSKCQKYGKSIHRDLIHSEFEKLLESIKPSDEVYELSVKIMIDAWTQKQGAIEEENSQIMKLKSEKLKQISDITKRLVLKIGQNDQDLINLYENQIKKLNQELDELNNKNNVTKFTDEQFRTSLKQVFGILKDPIAMWRSNVYEDKITIYLMYFDQKMAFDKTEGFRTPSISLPIALMSDIETKEKNYVEMARIELASREIHGYKGLVRDILSSL